MIKDRQIKYYNAKAKDSTTLHRKSSDDRARPQRAAVAQGNSGRPEQPQTKVL